ncbi:MAG: glycosyltransferase family 2 protein [Candidatus Aminicenantes bacterium]
MNVLNKMQREPEISVILVNHNNKSHLKECLLALEKSSLRPCLEFIVVDNNSSDGSRDFIRDHFPLVRLIGNQKNRGFSAANNQGIRLSKGDFILFLNPDTLPYAQSLNLMLQEIKSNPRVGAVGPALIKGENKFQVSFGSRVNFWKEFLQRCFLNPYHRTILKRSRKKKEVGWLSGACLLVRKDILDREDFFDENFFLYFEDIDLCLRMRKKGWKLIYLPQARVFHREGASTSLQKTAARYEYRKSQIYFYQKHNSRVSLFLLRLYLLLNFSFLFLFHGLGKGRNFKEQKRFFRLLKRKAKMSKA